MNIFRKLWQSIAAYRKDPGISDAPEAPPYTYIELHDPLYMEEKLQKAAGKKEK